MQKDIKKSKAEIEDLVSELNDIFKGKSLAIVILACLEIFDLILNNAPAEAMSELSLILKETKSNIQIVPITH